MLRFIEQNIFFYVNLTEACTVYSPSRLYTMKIKFKLTPKLIHNAFVWRKCRKSVVAFLRNLYLVTK